MTNSPTLSSELLDTLRQNSKDNASFERLVEAFELSAASAHDQWQAHYHAFNEELANHLKLIRDLESRWETLIKAIPVGIIIHNNIQIEYCNQAAADLLGVPSSVQLVALPLTRFATPHDLEHLQKFAAHPNSTTPLIVETDMLRMDDSTLTVEVRIARLHPDNPIFVSVVTDISARKNAERLRQETAQLEAAFHAESLMQKTKDALMRRISHEFRNPLAIIQTSAEIITRYRDRLDDVGMQKRTQQIIAQVDYLVVILEELGLMLEGQLHIDQIDLERFDLKALCEEVMGLMSAAVGGNATFTFVANPEAGDFHVVSDKRFMQFVLRHALMDTLMRASSNAHVDFYLQQNNGGVMVCTRTFLDESSADDERDVTMHELFYDDSLQVEQNSNLKMLNDVVQLLGGQFTPNPPEFKTEHKYCLMVMLPTQWTESVPNQ